MYRFQRAHSKLSNLSDTGYALLFLLLLVGRIRTWCDVYAWHVCHVIDAVR